jgi:hypothetical protein
MVWVVAIEDDQNFENYAKAFPTKSLAERFAVKYAIDFTGVIRVDWEGEEYDVDNKEEKKEFIKKVKKSLKENSSYTLDNGDGHYIWKVEIMKMGILEYRNTDWSYSPESD